MSKKTLVILLGICLLAFIVRMAFIGLFPALFSPDTPGYLEPAANLVAGRGYVTNAGVPYIAREPGYPTLIAFNYLLWGQSDYPVKVTQVVLAALMCLPIFVIGQVVFDEAVGLLAALILALYPTLIPGVGFILTETFFTFLLSVTMALLIIFLRFRRWWVLVLAGITLGLAVLTRSGLLIFPFLMALGFLVTAQSKKQAVINSLLLLASTLVVVLPWTIRNYLAFGQLIPVHVAGGTSLYHGSHVIWQGDWWGGPEQVAAQAAIVGGETNPIKIDALLGRVALQNIKQDVGGYLALIPLKIWRLWGQVPGNQVFLADYPLVHWGLWLVWWLTLLGAGLGAWVYRARWQSYYPILILFLYYTLVHSFLLARARYFIPLEPYVIIFASAGVLSLVSSYQQRQAKSL